MNGKYKPVRFPVQAFLWIEGVYPSSLCANIVAGNTIFETVVLLFSGSSGVNIGTDDKLPNGK